MFQGRSPVCVNTNNPQLLVDSYPLSLLKLLRAMREIKKKSPFASLVLGEIVWVLEMFHM